MNILLRMDVAGLLDHMKKITFLVSKFYLYKSRIKNCSVYMEDKVLFY